MLHRYDLGVFVLISTVQHVYLTYAVLGRSGVSALVTTLDPLALGHYMPEPVPAELYGQYMYHKIYVANALALACMPHLLFKLPVVGELLHQVRAISPPSPRHLPAISPPTPPFLTPSLLHQVRLTGFDQAGHLHLMMSSSDMQLKWDREVQIKYGDGWAPNVKVSSIVDDFVVGGVGSMLGGAVDATVSGTGALLGGLGSIIGVGKNREEAGGQPLM